ncbi:hypothetical protein ACIOTI_42005 [Streptomyces sp. NPDC087843]|uniref:hypothetical protein n=1 Tax=Streptomyces sp. NPDC087843 TaxID=3365804 RepID=UPI003813A47B
MKVPFSSGSLLYTAGGLLGVCVAALGAGAGFLLESWWSVGCGLIVGVGVFLLTVRTTFLLCSLHMRETLSILTKGDAEGEAAANMVLHAVTLYEAAVFPLRPGGVSPAERELRRLVAYRLAAREGLPQLVRVAAAEALGTIEQVQDPKQAQAAVWTLNETVRDCRPGFIHLHDDQAS